MAETPPTKVPAWKVGGATILTFVALLYVIEIVDQLTGHALDRNGIRPLETDGLRGSSSHRYCTRTGDTCWPTPCPPGAGLSGDPGRDGPVRLGHGDHLDRRRIGTWLLGNIDGCPLETNHIGASGLIFRLAGVPAGVRLADPAFVADRDQPGGAVRVRRHPLGRGPGAQRLRECPGRAISPGGRRVLAAYWLSRPERQARPSGRTVAARIADVNDRFAPSGSSTPGGRADGRALDHRPVAR